MELYEHNIRPYLELKKLQPGECSVFVTATGTGKSYVAGKIIEETDENVLIITPKKAISNQWENLLESCIHRCDVKTYQYLSRTKPEDYEKTFSRYGLIIVDEAHHAGADVWGRPIKYCIDHAKEMNLSVIGLTADSVRYSDGGYDVCDEIFNKHRTEGLLLEDAIGKGILPSFNYISALYDFPDDIYKAAKRPKRTMTLDKLLGRLNIDCDNLTRMTNIIVQNLSQSKTDINHRHVIIFASSTDEFENAYDLAKSIGITDVFEISHKVSAKKNKNAISSFERSQNAALLCIDMLNEGVHCKPVDTIIMLRRTTSPNIFFQQLGRALDSGSEKDIWVFDFVANAKVLDFKSTSSSRRTITISSVLQKCCDQKIIKDYATECFDLIREIRYILADKARWHKNEDSILRKFYSSEGEDCFSRLPERSITACRNRCYYLGLSHKPWSDEEIATMTKYYATEGYSIAKRLNDKTESQIANMACKLKLRKEQPDDWSQQDKSVLRNFYEKEGTSVSKRLSKQYTAAQIKMKAKAEGLTFDRHLWTDDEISVVKKFYPDINKCMSLLPGRTQSAIKRQATIANVTEQANTPWSDKDIQYLRDHYNDMTRKQISEKLHRSEGSIKAQCRKLHLTKRK